MKNKENNSKSSFGSKVVKVIAATILALMTLLIALIIGLPLYLYIPLGAFVFLCVGLGFYLFSLRRNNQQPNVKIESQETTSDVYQNPPPPPKF